MRRLFFLLVLVLVITVSSSAIEDCRMLKFPDINGNKVAFVYGGDIWTVPANGGDATRLTSHPGMELFPRISPDGKWIAFIGEYNGSHQLYVMPYEGGEPKQLTYYNDGNQLPLRAGFDHIPMDWTPDSKKIMFRTLRTPYTERNGKYYIVDRKGGLETPLPIPIAGFGSFSPDGSKICYAPIETEFIAWKRGKSGKRADVWIYDLKKNTSERITTFPGTDYFPYWFKNKIYFTSDRDLKLNVYSYDLGSKKIEQITHHTEHDVRWPSGERNLLVYESNGYLYKLDFLTGEEKKITVNLDKNDFEPIIKGKNVSKYIRGYDISPDGEKVIFDARGDLFEVDVKNGNTINLTDSQGIREINPRYSPDGKSMAYYSDRSGEYEIYIYNRQKKTHKQLTHNSSTWKYPGKWSPDSQKFLFSDKDQSLHYIDIPVDKINMVSRSNLINFREFEWSPDSNWIIYSDTGENYQNSLWTYSLESKEKKRLIGTGFSNFSPTFSKCGHYVFFLSERTFGFRNRQSSDLGHEYVYNNTTGVYIVKLKKNGPPFNKITRYGTKKRTASEKLVASINRTGIDFEDIADRVYSLPLPGGDYSNLTATESGIIYIKENENALLHFDPLTKKETKLTDAPWSYRKSKGDKHILIKKGRDRFLVNHICLELEENTDSKLIKTDGLVMNLDQKKEWQQIFNDVWRKYRDGFYAINLHGIDWVRNVKKFEPLLPYVTHRDDLNFIIAEMISELNAGHLYILRRGDRYRGKRGKTGLLGALLVPDSRSGRYYFKKIYKGRIWDQRFRSPLCAEDVNIHEGDYLISLNGHPVTTKDNPFKYMKDTVGKEVIIKVNKSPRKRGSRSFTIKPIANEQNLMYLDWVTGGCEMVDRLSGGRIGYFHIPDTAFRGEEEVIKSIHALNHKDALLIDIRYNKGGNFPVTMNKLLELTPYFYLRVQKRDIYKYPFHSTQCPKAMLMNHYCFSGGDSFPFLFSTKKLGPLIGTRTGGGGIAGSEDGELVDYGYIRVPYLGLLDGDGNWIIEGIGVKPDIEVYDEPHKIAAGEDPSIEKGVEVLLKMLKDNPPQKIKKPAEPDRSKWIEEEIK